MGDFRLAEVNGTGRAALLQHGPLQDDEPLLALEQRIANLMGLSQGLEDDDHLDQFGRELDRLENEIRDAVPTTPAGIAVKVRQLWSNVSGDSEPDDFENLKTIHEALRRLERQCGGLRAEPSRGEQQIA